jgi:thiol-disulfide isomerase/thioredoxin
VDALTFHPQDDTLQWTGEATMVRTLGWVAVTAAVGCVPRLYTQDADEPWSWEAPDNQWESREPPAGTRGDGFSEGQIVPDFLLRDQFGDDVSLWQFYGNVVVLDISTMWCAPCQELAQHTEETVQDYAGEEFVYVTVLQEDPEGDPPGVDDLVEWAELFGITAPVLDDGTKQATGTAVFQGQYPAVLVIDRQLRVAERVNPIEDAEVRKAIEAAL